MINAKYDSDADQIYLTGFSPGDAFKIGAAEELGVDVGGSRDAVELVGELLQAILEAGWVEEDRIGWTIKMTPVL